MAGRQRGVVFPRAVALLRGHALRDQFVSQPVVVVVGGAQRLARLPARQRALALQVATCTVLEPRLGERPPSIAHDLIEGAVGREYPLHGEGRLDIDRTRTHALLHRQRHRLDSYGVRALDHRRVPTVGEPQVRRQLVGEHKAAGMQCQLPRTRALFSDEQHFAITHQEASAAPHGQVALHLLFQHDSPVPRYRGDGHHLPDRVVGGPGRFGQHRRIHLLEGDRLSTGNEGDAVPGRQIEFLGRVGGHRQPGAAHHGRPGLGRRFQRQQDLLLHLQEQALAVGLQVVQGLARHGHAQARCARDHLQHLAHVSSGCLAHVHDRPHSFWHSGHT